MELTIEYIKHNLYFGAVQPSCTYTFQLSVRNHQAVLQAEMSACSWIIYYYSSRNFVRHPWKNLQTVISSIHCDSQPVGYGPLVEGPAVSYVKA